jgi:hypothetical protein
MPAVPISSTSGSIQLRPSAPALTKQEDWTHLLAAGTVIAGGALMVAGHKRAGMAVAVAGTAIALFEEQDAVKGWWKNLPGYLNDAQHFLDKIEGYLTEASVQGQRIQSILRR